MSSDSFYLSLFIWLACIYGCDVRWPFKHCCRYRKYVRWLFLCQCPNDYRMLVCISVISAIHCMSQHNIFFFFIHTVLFFFFLIKFLYYPLVVKLATHSLAIMKKKDHACSVLELMVSYYECRSGINRGKKTLSEIHMRSTGSCHGRNTMNMQTCFVFLPGK